MFKEWILRHKPRIYPAASHSCFEVFSKVWPSAFLAPSLNPFLLAPPLNDVIVHVADELDSVTDLKFEKYRPGGALEKKKNKNLQWMNGSNLFSSCHKWHRKEPAGNGRSNRLTEGL